MALDEVAGVGNALGRAIAADAGAMVRVAPAVAPAVAPVAGIVAAGAAPTTGTETGAVSAIIGRGASISANGASRVGSTAAANVCNSPGASRSDSASVAAAAVQKASRACACEKKL